MKVAIVICVRVKVGRTEIVLSQLTGCLDIFKPITALKSPWKTAHYIGIKLDHYIQYPDNREN